jgi:GTP-binding protein
MRIHSAEFLQSAGRPDQFPDGGRPEVAFAGRSNVGKSSLINRLLGRRGLARTSSTPGRTRTINFYTVNDAFLFADLPGYGYAKVSRALQEEWWVLVEKYLADRRPLRGVVHLTDARHPPTEQDRELHPRPHQGRQSPAWTAGRGAARGVRGAGDGGAQRHRFLGGNG